MIFQVTFAVNAEGKKFAMYQSMHTMFWANADMVSTTVREEIAEGVYGSAVIGYPVNFTITGNGEGEFVPTGDVNGQRGYTFVGVEF